MFDIYKKVQVLAIHLLLLSLANPIEYIICTFDTNIPYHSNLFYSLLGVTVTFN